MAGPTAALAAAREVALAQARTLARHGRYAEAEDLLSALTPATPLAPDAPDAPAAPAARPWPNAADVAGGPGTADVAGGPRTADVAGGPETADAVAGAGGSPDAARGDVAVLDLRARIHAQQGRLDEADRCWAAAERLVPGDAEIAEIAAARRRIAAIRAGVRPRPAGTIVPRAAGAVAAAVALALLTDTWLETRESRPAAGPAPVTVTPSPRAPGAPGDAAGGDLPAGMEVQAPGVVVRRRPGELSVAFRQGLFTRGATLSPGARTVLRALAADLRPYANRIAVDVIGHTDGRAVRPGGQYGDNVELGTLRATVVREVLGDASGVPAARFAVSTTAGALPPYSGRAAATRARNRTVTLRISAAGGR